MSLDTFNIYTHLLALVGELNFRFDQPSTNKRSVRVFVEHAVVKTLAKMVAFEDHPHHTANKSR